MLSHVNREACLLLGALCVPQPRAADTSDSSPTTPDLQETLGG